MSVDLSQVRRIGMGLLHAHPKNANVMGAGVRKKLTRHLKETGRYEPLVVRPHPTIAGEFELINGHHRKEILESLGHTEANCIVWDLTDSETLVLLATINRLGGEDAPSKRLALLETLAAALERDSAELAKMLPEDEATLEGLLHGRAAEIAAPANVGEMPEAFTVFLRAEDKRKLVAALRETAEDFAEALMAWVAEKNPNSEF